MFKVTLKIRFQAGFGTRALVSQQKAFPSEDTAIVPRDPCLRLVLKECHRDLRAAKTLGHCDPYSVLRC